MALPRNAEDQGQSYIELTAKGAAEAAARARQSHEDGAGGGGKDGGAGGGKKSGGSSGKGKSDTTSALEKAIQAGRDGFDPSKAVINPAAPSAGGSTGGGATQAHKMIMDELINRGVRPEVAAGAVGSLMGESGSRLNPAAYNPNDNGSPSGGIAQWHKERLDGLYKFAGTNDINKIPLETQVKYLGHELDTTHKHVLEGLLQGRTVQDGNSIWTRSYEVPANADHQVELRQKNGDSLWSSYSNNSFASATPSAPVGEAAPGQIRSNIAVNGHTYEFGSGGAGRGAIPEGHYPITPNEMGAWGQAHGAIGINHNAIYDKNIGDYRRGIEFHSATNDRLITQGCISVAGDKWPQFKQDVMQVLKENGKAYLHVDKNGASVTAFPDAKTAYTDGAGKVSMPSADGSGHQVITADLANKELKINREAIPSAASIRENTAGLPANARSFVDTWNGDDMAKGKNNIRTDDTRWNDPGKAENARNNPAKPDTSGVPLPPSRPEAIPSIDRGPTAGAASIPNPRVDAPTPPTRPESFGPNPALNQGTPQPVKPGVYGGDIPSTPYTGGQWTDPGHWENRMRSETGAMGHRRDGHSLPQGTAVLGMPQDAGRASQFEQQQLSWQNATKDNPAAQQDTAIPRVDGGPAAGAASTPTDPNGDGIPTIYPDETPDVLRTAPNDDKLYIAAKDVQDPMSFHPNMGPPMPHEQGPPMPPETPKAVPDTAAANPPPPTAATPQQPAQQDAGSMDWLSSLFSNPDNLNDTSGTDAAGATSAQSNAGGNSDFGGGFDAIGSALGSFFGGFANGGPVPGFAKGGLVTKENTGRPDRVASAQPGVSPATGSRNTNPGGGYSARLAISPGYALGGPVDDDPFSNFLSGGDAPQAPSEEAAPTQVARAEPTAPQEAPPASVTPAIPEGGFDEAPIVGPSSQEAKRQADLEKYAEHRRIAAKTKQPKNFKEMLAGALTNAINGVEQDYGIHAAGTRRNAQQGQAVPTDGSGGDDLITAFGNMLGLGPEKEAATPEQVAALSNAVDPNYKLTEGIRTTAGLVAGYEHLLAQGDTKGAQEVARSIIFHQQMLVSRYGDQAVELLKKGDTEGAVTALTKAQQNIPDGTNVSAKPTEDGGAIVTHKDASGEVIQKVRVTEQQLLGAALGLKDGSAYWQSLTSAAQGGTKLNISQPDPAYEQYQQRQPTAITPPEDNSPEYALHKRAINYLGPMPTLPGNFSQMSKEHQDQVRKGVAEERAAWTTQYTNIMNSGRQQAGFTHQDTSREDGQQFQQDQQKRTFDHQDNNKVSTGGYDKAVNGAVTNMFPDLDPADPRVSNISTTATNILHNNPGMAPADAVKSATAVLANKGTSVQKDGKTVYKLPDGREIILPSAPTGNSPIPAATPAPATGTWGRQ
jgi:hypothetical protein